MGKTSKEGSDSKRKRKRVAVESSSDDDESEQDFEEVTKKVTASQVGRVFLRVTLTMELSYCCC